MDLFHEIEKRAISESSFQGRASHILLSLFNRGYLAGNEGIGLDDEIWSKETGQPVNPTFKVDQADLPVNLQIRKSIESAVISDMKYQQGIASGENLAGQRAQWYQSLHKNMSGKVLIQPAEQPLK